MPTTEDEVLPAQVVTQAELRRAPLPRRQDEHNLSRDPSAIPLSHKQVAKPAALPRRWSPGDARFRTVRLHPHRRRQQQGSGNGMIAYLDYGGFGGGSNPQTNYNPFLDATNLAPQTTCSSSYAVRQLLAATRSPGSAPATPGPTRRPCAYTLRACRWNDGKPFSAADVAFTFQLRESNPALDTQGVWRYLKSVTAPDPKTVVMTFNQPCASAFTLINNVPIVPEHVWSAVRDPVTFVNADKPVGTGPFTVKSFNPQQLILARNPNYWQADEVKVQELRFHKSDDGGREVDQLRLSHGEYDTNSMFVQDIKKTFVDRDPQHFHYWYPPGGAISLYMNLTKAPFDDVASAGRSAYAFDHQRITEPGRARLRRAGQPDRARHPRPGGLGAAGQCQTGQCSRTTRPNGPRSWSSRRVPQVRPVRQAARQGRQADQVHLQGARPASLDWVSAAHIVMTTCRPRLRRAAATPTRAIYENDRAIGSFDMLFGVQGGPATCSSNFAEPLGERPCGPSAARGPAEEQLRALARPATDRCSTSSTPPTTPASRRQLAGLGRIDCPCTRCR